MRAYLTVRWALGLLGVDYCQQTIYSPGSIEFIYFKSSTGIRREIALLTSIRSFTYLDRREGMKIKALIAGMTLAILSASVSAVTSVGAIPCGAWIKARSGSTWEQTVVQAWLMGFLSGIASNSNKDFLREPDPESLLLWVDNYCRANPLHNTFKAGDALFVELSKSK